MSEISKGVKGGYASLENGPGKDFDDGHLSLENLATHSKTKNVDQTPLASRKWMGSTNCTRRSCISTSRQVCTSSFLGFSSADFLVVKIGCNSDTVFSRHIGNSSIGERWSDFHPQRANDGRLIRVDCCHWQRRTAIIATVTARSVPHYSVMGTVLSRSSLPRKLHKV
jgi:hypothetical protein